MGKDVYDLILAAGHNHAALHKENDPGTARLFGFMLGLAAERADRNRRELEYDLGIASAQRLYSHYPSVFKAFVHPRELLNNLSSIHTSGLEKASRPDVLPGFVVIDQGEGKMLLSYEAHRFPRFFTKGLLMGISEYYQVNVQIKQIDCQRNKDHYSLFFIEFYE